MPALRFGMAPTAAAARALRLFVSPSLRLFLFSAFALPAFAQTPADGGGSGGWWPAQASRGAVQVDIIFIAMIALSALVILLVGALILGFGLKYRAASTAYRSDTLGHTTALEVTWIVVPLFLMLGVFVWAATVFFDLTTPPAEARTIYVVGKQWMWKVQHPSGRQEINELHVPAGEPVKLVLSSQDVIHSFFVPAFRVKQDALPGAYTTLWFEPTTIGEYFLFCAEYCGTDHAGMRGRVVVMSPANYQRWLGGGPVLQAPVPGVPGSPQAPLALGGRGPFYRFGCNACHVPDAAVRAPRLDGLYGREVKLNNDQVVIADEQYLRESILDPNARIVAGYDAPSLMPTYKGQINEQQLVELIEFIKSIEEGWPEEGK